MTLLKGWYWFLLIKVMDAIAVVSPELSQRFSEWSGLYQRVRWALWLLQSGQHPAAVQTAPRNP